MGRRRFAFYGEESILLSNMNSKTNDIKLSTLAIFTILTSNILKCCTGSTPLSYPNISPFSPLENHPPFCVYPPFPRTPPLPPHTKPPEHRVWCVAKPTVPSSSIQVAMDYACGSGADCVPIQLNGLCYQPDTVLAHASYAFNSYWQRTKRAGGTCNFGGLAMLVTVDPSYDQCHFIYD